MTTQTYAATMFGNTFSIRANFAEASGQVEREIEDGEWIATGHQVAEYQHIPADAMRAELEWNIEAGHDDPAEFEDEIEEAVEAMEAK